MSNVVNHINKINHHDLILIWMINKDKCCKAQSWMHYLYIYERTYVEQTSGKPKEDLDFFFFRQQPLQPKSNLTRDDKLFSGLLSVKISEYFWILQNYLCEVILNFELSLLLQQEVALIVYYCNIINKICTTEPPFSIGTLVIISSGAVVNSFFDCITSQSHFDEDRWNIKKSKIYYNGMGYDV